MPSSLLERILAELGVDGARGAGLAAVEEKAIQRKRSELERLQLSNRVPQRLQGHWVLDAGQGQVRGERAVLLGDAERRQYSFGIAHQLRQRVAGLHSYPKNARMIRIG